MNAFDFLWVGILVISITFYLRLVESVGNNRKRLDTIEMQLQELTDKD